VKITTGQETTWAEYQNKNTDMYGAGIIRYAQKWADLMEAQMGTGALIGDVAEKTSRDADTEGITGFMYGAAVLVLARVWEHGEMLRRWHNLKTQIGTEGEKANASGGVLNPAILTVNS
jgi:hypothetical protein